MEGLKAYDNSLFSLSLSLSFVSFSLFNKKNKTKEKIEIDR